LYSLKEHPKSLIFVYMLPRLKLSALDVDEPELTAIQLPSYHMKHGQRPTSGGDASDQDSQLRDSEIKLWCTEADSGILAVRAASLVLSAVKKARDLDYRGQAGITCSQRNLQKAELMKSFEITMYNNARAALINLGHMEKDAVEPYRPLSSRDTRRKETHLHRAKGDSRLLIDPRLPHSDIALKGISHLICSRVSLCAALTVSRPIASHCYCRFLSVVVMMRAVYSRLMALGFKPERTRFCFYFRVFFFLYCPSPT
jgi:hypothetical protein